MKTTLNDFAVRHRLHLRRHPDDSTDIILGHLGHIFEYADGVLGVRFMPQPPRSHLWPYARRRLVAAGFVLTQNGGW